MSKMFSLVPEDVKRVIVHLVVFGLAAAAVAVLEQWGSFSSVFGPYQALTSVIAGAVLDTLRKWVSDNTPV